MRDHGAFFPRLQTCILKEDPRNYADDVRDIGRSTKENRT